MVIKESMKLIIKRQIIEKKKHDCISFKIIEEPYNLSLDVRKVFPGSEAGISSTLISLALFLQGKKEVCDLSSQKLSRKKSKSQQHFSSVTHKDSTPILNLHLTFYFYQSLEAAQCLFL